MPQGRAVPRAIFRESTWAALRGQLASSPHWVVAELDRAGRITACSPGFLRLLGRAALPAGTPFGSLLVADGSEPPGLPAPGELRRLRVTFAAAGGTSQVLTCTLSGTPEGCALAGETALLTHDDMVARMSSLQDELANANRELQQKIRELERSQHALSSLLEDVNEIRAELEHSNQRLQGLDRLKSMFIASMSHEFRTPLNSIIGFAGVMLQGLAGPVNDERRDQLGRVFRAGKHLLALITDVIDISKIEAEKVTPYPSDFVLAGVVEEAVGTLRSQAAEKGLALTVELPPEPVSLHTDRKRLLQCLLNLVSNAVKFTEAGEVAVTAAAVGDAVEIAVADTGIGIRAEDLGLLFQSFVRLDSPLKIGTPGTGLGLYLTRKLAEEVLGGTVRAESREGVGSRFTLRVPRVLGS